MTLRPAHLVHLARTLLRFWGLSLLNIAGLAIGFAAAMIIGLYIFDELTFDRSIPGAEKTYILTAHYGAASRPLVPSDKTPAGMAHWLQSDVTEVQSVSRLHPVEMPVKSERHAGFEKFYWADPNIFDLLELKAVSGDLRTALSQPDTVVLTQRMARKYFGSEDVIGKTLTINTYLPARVTAVLADHAPNTTFDREMFVSARASYSMTAILDQRPTWQWASVYTFVRLKPGAKLLPETLKEVAKRHWASPHNLPAKIELIPLLQLHFAPDADGQEKSRGHRDSVAAMAGVACLILILAAINFFGLLTAQVDERREEMAVRRTLGGKPHHLSLQVLGEATVVSMLATVAAFSIVEHALPTINSKMGLHLDLWRSPLFAAAGCLTAVLTGILAGLVPAIILGRGTPRHPSASVRPYLTRVSWIAIQLSLLMTLLIASQTVYRQWSFATGAALNFDASQVLLVPVNSQTGNPQEFKRQVLATPGVEAAGLSRYTPIFEGTWPAWIKSPSGKIIQFSQHSVDPQFFDVYRVPILAGRRFSNVSDSQYRPKSILINRSALAAFGYRRPEDAVGRELTYHADNQLWTSRIIGVVEDMRIATVREPISPMVFDNQSVFFTHLSVRLTNRDNAQTLAAIDSLWQRANPDSGPLEPYFFSDYIANQYRDIKQQWWAFGLLSVVGICLSVLGLSGLSIYLARARLHEIAIRNALGARLVDIMRLRLEPLLKPLIIANLAGSAASWALMSWWLNSFKAHVGLSLLSFVVAGTATVTITLLTVATHIFLSSPARSSQPLRAD